MTARSDSEGAVVRTLERSSYRSVPEVLDRYGVPICRLYAWRERGDFPPAVHVGYRSDRHKVAPRLYTFFNFLSMVRWELARHGRRGAAQ